MSTRAIGLLALPVALSCFAFACSDGTDDGGVGATAGNDGHFGTGGDGTTGIGTGGTGTGGGSGGSGVATPSTEPTCGDASCDFPGGFTHGECGTRFALGMNYAWQDFGADFGGMAAWGLPGVTGNSAAVSAALADMSANGATALRWWMFPDFRGDGVEFDENGDATGISATAVADIQKALELADAANVNLVLTIFSFDNFRPTRDEGTGAGLVTLRGMTPMVADPTRRAALIEGVVRPVAEAVAASPHADRLLAWDLINEPEWAIAAEASGFPNGGNFAPDTEGEPAARIDPIALADIKAFMNESLAVLEEETPNVPKSIGWAAAKWQWAFDDVTGVDFHQPHIYAWVNDWWPYTQTPAQLGYDDGKPTVMGEFYLLPMPFNDADHPDSTVTLADVLNSWFANGYAGAWAWQYTDTANFAQNLPLLANFAAEKGCVVRY